MQRVYATVFKRLRFAEPLIYGLRRHIIIAQIRRFDKRRILNRLIVELAQMTDKIKPFEIVLT